MTSSKTCDKCSGKGKIHTAETLAHEDENCLWCDDCAICKGKGIVEIIETQSPPKEQPAESKRRSRTQSVVNDRPASVVIKDDVVIREDEGEVEKAEDNLHNGTTPEAPNDQSEAIAELRKRLSQAQLDQEQAETLSSAVAESVSEGSPGIAELAKPKIKDRVRTGSLSSQTSSPSGVITPNKRSLFQTFRKKAFDSESKISLANSEKISIISEDDNSPIFSSGTTVGKEELEAWYSLVVKIQKKKSEERDKSKVKKRGNEAEVTTFSLFGNDTEDALDSMIAASKMYANSLHGASFGTISRNRLESVQPRQSAIASIGNVPKFYLIPLAEDRRVPAHLLADYEDDGVTISRMFSIREADLLEHVLNPFLIDPKAEDLLLMSYRYFMDPKKLLDYLMAFFKCLPKPSGPEALVQAVASGKKTLLRKPTDHQASTEQSSDVAGKGNNQTTASIMQRKKKEQEEKEKNEYFKKQAGIIRGNAFRVLLKWIQSYWYDFHNDAILLARVEKIADDLTNGTPLEGLEEEIFYNEGIRLTEAIRHQKLNFAESSIQHMKQFSTLKRRNESNAAIPVILEKKEVNADVPETLIGELITKIKKAHKENSFVDSMEAQRLAEVLSLLEWEQFQRISVGTYVDLLRAVGTSQKSSALRPTLHHVKEIVDQNQHQLRPMMDYIHYWTTVHDLVVTSVLCCDTPKERGNVIKKWIKAAQTCHYLNNFATMSSIVKALMCPGVFQLNYSWSQLKKKHMLMLREMASLLELDELSISGKYELLIAETKIAQPPIIPLLPPLLRELQRIYDSSADLERIETHVGLQKSVEYVVNMEKFSGIYSIFNSLRLYNQVSYRSYAEQIVRETALANKIAEQQPPSIVFQAKKGLFGATITKKKEVKKPSTLSRPNTADSTSSPTRSMSGLSIVSSITSPAKQPLEKTASGKSFAVFSKASTMSSLGASPSTGNKDSPTLNGYIPLATLKEIDDSGQLRIARERMAALLKFSTHFSASEMGSEVTVERSLNELIQVSSTFGVIRNSETAMLVSGVAKKKDDTFDPEVIKQKNEELKAAAEGQARRSSRSLTAANKRSFNGEVIKEEKEPRQESQQNVIST